MRGWLLVIAAAAACGGAVVDESLGTRHDVDYAHDGGTAPPRPTATSPGTTNPGRPVLPPRDSGGREEPAECSGRCVPMRCEDYDATRCGILDDGCGGTIRCDRPCVSLDGGDCVPITCVQYKMQCGTYADGCGGIVQCSSCPTGRRCSTAPLRSCIPCDDAGP